MLNPFAIEKDILNKVAAIKKVVNAIKETVGSKILQKADRYNFELDQDILDQCTNVIAQSTAITKCYVCKICNKTFNDGRKLGGHVSRAHKQNEEYMSDSQSLEDLSEKEKNRISQKHKKRGKKLLNSSLKRLPQNIKMDEQPDASVFGFMNSDCNAVKIEEVYYSSSDQK